MKWLYPITAGTKRFVTASFGQFIAIVKLEFLESIYFQQLA